MTVGYFCIILVFVINAFSLTLDAKINSPNAQNLSICLSGQYPALCNKNLLNKEELNKAYLAERRENLKTCLTGLYPALCNKTILSSDELQRVTASERRENLKTCLTGQYKALCNKNLLSELELKQVLFAEKTENLKTCLTGWYPALCDHSLLTTEQRTKVQAAEKRAYGAIRQYTNSISATPKGSHGIPQRSQAFATGLTFHGYDCTVDCSGHEAGYNWAEENDLDDEDDCDGNSESFNEGCRSYVEENIDSSSDDDDDDFDDE